MPGEPFFNKGNFMIGRKRIFVHDHPNAHVDGSIYEYIYVASQKLGRPL